MAQATLQKNTHPHSLHWVNPLVFTHHTSTFKKYKIEFTILCTRLNSEMPHPRAALLEKMYPWWVIDSFNKWAKGKCNL